MRVILVTGSREWTDKAALRQELARQATGGEVLLVHGGARGADTVADEWVHDYASLNGVTAMVLPAQWDKHGRSAGPRRNAAMVALCVVLRDHGHDVVCVAAPLGESRGTRDCMRQCERAEIPVHVVEVSS